jgi:hypothetical protein
MSDIKVDIVLPGQVNTNVESPSQSVTANVSIPSAINVDIISPTQAFAANVILPEGPQGPRGADGVGTLINGFSGNLFFTGADGVSILATGNNILVVSGNSGYFQRLIDNLFLQTRTISGSLEVLGSGFFTSGVKVGTGTVFIEPSRILINGDPVITRSGLNAVSGYFESENTIGYSYTLPVGNDNYFVTYPSVLNSDPRSINCIFQNNVDNIIYYYSLGNINKTGFYINFSDQINNTGYSLNINVKK